VPPSRWLVHEIHQIAATSGRCSRTLDHLDPGHEQEVENAELVVFLVDDKRAPGRRHRQNIRVRNVKGAAVRHADVEGVERRRTTRGAHLLYGHRRGLECAKMKMQVDRDISSTAPAGPVAAEGSFTTSPKRKRGSRKTPATVFLSSHRGSNRLASNSMRYRSNRGRFE
jgi:hypothetical protein